MVQDRLKELIDFASTESPYQEANKGWLTDDVYLRLGNSSDSLPSEKEKVADISVYWNPIKKIILILLSVILLASTLVFSAVSFANGRFKISIDFPTEVIVSENLHSADTLFDEIEEIKEIKEIEEIESGELSISKEPDLIKQNEITADQNDSEKLIKDNASSSGNLEKVEDPLISSNQKNSASRSNFF